MGILTPLQWLQSEVEAIERNNRGDEETSI